MWFWCYTYLPKYFQNIYFQGIHQGSCHTSEEQESCGSGISAYLCRAIGVSWSVVNDGKNSRFSSPLFWINSTIHPFHLDP